MKTKLYTPLEEMREIPTVRETWRRCFLQLVALDYDILRCLRKLSQGKQPVLAPAVGNPYNATIDQCRLDTIFLQYRCSFVNFDRLFSKNVDELESEKWHLKDFLFNYSLASRLWLDKSEVKSEVTEIVKPTRTSKGSAKYRVLVSGGLREAEENIRGKDPSYIEILIEDNNEEALVIKDDIIEDPSKEVKANLTVKYPDDAINKQNYKLYVKKGTTPMTDTVDDVSKDFYIRQIYLSEDAKINGDVVQAYLLYRTNLLLRHCISYAMLYTDVFHGLLYTKSGDGYTQVSEENISAQVEEVMGEVPQHEIKDIFVYLLRSIGKTLNDKAVVSMVFPAWPIELPEGQINDMRQLPPDAEKLMNYAGLTIIRNKIVELIGSDASNGLPIVGSLLVDIMSSLINSKSAAPIMIDELDTSMKSIKERFSISRSTSDQQRFFPEASRIVLAVLGRAELSEFVEEAGLDAIHSLRENPTSENLLDVFSSLQFPKLAEAKRILGQSLNYSDLYWDNGFSEGVLDRHYTVQWARSEENLLDDYYDYCLKRMVVDQKRQEGEVEGAVFLGSLLDEDTSISAVPLVAELHRYERDQKREIDRLQRPGTLAEYIESVVGGRL